jgi:hypothetical protein
MYRVLIGPVRSQVSAVKRATTRRVCLIFFGFVPRRRGRCLLIAKTWASENFCVIVPGLAAVAAVKVYNASRLH